jgi:ribonucleotide monophosphatase NagD (HAD superfamily)
MENIPKTIICDIDGCILEHQGNLIEMQLKNPVLLPGVKEKFDEWEKKSYKIIFLTGRKESMRQKTEEDLRSLGLFWDVLVMGATRGQRVLINDFKPNNDTATAVAINLTRNQGLGLCQNV